jgi:hypothetical protein
MGATRMTREESNDLIRDELNHLTVEAGAIANRPKLVVGPNAIEEMKEELLVAGWTYTGHHRWRSPWSTYFLGPYEAWKVKRWMDTQIKKDIERLGR